jgi:hypothetical protein
MNAGSREGSRPRDPLLAKPSTFYYRGRKYPFWLSDVLAARGDPTSPTE